MGAAESVDGVVNMLCAFFLTHRGDGVYWHGTFVTFYEDAVPKII